MFMLFFISTQKNKEGCDSLFEPCQHPSYICFSALALDLKLQLPPQELSVLRAAVVEISGDKILILEKRIDIF